MAVQRISTQALRAPSPAIPPNKTPHPVREFLAWAATHQPDQRLHGAGWAQITRHRALKPGGKAVHHLQAWTVRKAQERHLHESSMAQLRP